MEDGIMSLRWGSEYIYFFFLPFERRQMPRDHRLKLLGIIDAIINKCMSVCRMDRSNFIVNLTRREYIKR